MNKRGFAALPKGKHYKLSSKGGKAKVPKGFSALSSEDRIKVARKGAQTLWEKRRKEVIRREAINSAEDGRPNENI